MLSETKIVSELDAFTKYLTARKMAKSSIKTYTGVLNKYLRSLDSEPSRQTAESLVEYLTNYKSGCTMGQVRGTFMHYFEGMLGQQKKLKRVPQPKREKKLPLVLSPAQTITIIEKTTNIKHKAIIALLYYAALRRSEVCNLKFKHISANSLFIEQSKGAKDRSVPLSPRLKDILKAYFSQYYPNGKCHREDFVFCGQVGGQFAGGQYTGRSIEAVVNTYSLKAIGRKINPHLLRHCRATDWLNNGFNILEVSRMLGHQNVKTTEIYLHLANETLESKMAGADNLMLSKCVAA